MHYRTVAHHNDTAPDARRVQAHEPAEHPAQLTILPIWMAGILTLAQSGDGLYWVVPDILLAFVKTIYDVWILVIEINR